MKYRKFNKFEKKEVRKQVIEKALAGEGLYLFRNNSAADLTLPRPTKSGVRVVGPWKEFQGDNYYLQLVRTGQLRLVKELQSPEAQQQMELKEHTMEEKLILDQPDTVTTKGKVEHVVDHNVPSKPLREQSGDGEEVLLNEGPVEGGFVFVDDE